MGQFTQAVQQLYVAYFNRPGDFAGEQFWESVVASQGGKTDAVSTAFAMSAEYTSQIAGKSSIAIVDQTYMNLFGHPADPGGLAFFSLLIDTGALPLSKVVTSIAGGAQGTDAVAYANKVAAATIFTNQLDTNAKIVAYDGAAANVAAKAYIASVTDDASFAAATAQPNLDLVNAAVMVARDGATNAAQTLAFTTSIDSLVGGKGNDTINAFSTTADVFTSFDTVDGGSGIDTLVVKSGTGAAFVAPTTATVTNVEKVIITADKAVTINTTSYTGLTDLSTSSIGASTVTAATTTKLAATAANLSGGAVTLKGGSTVTANIADLSSGSVTISGASGAISLAATGTTGGGTLTVTGNAGGAVTVSNTTTGNTTTAGTINVTGGTTVSVTQAATNAVNTTAANGVVNVTGTSATTAVTVNNASATASATVAGVTAAAVNITDVNGGGASKVAGTITTASVSGFTTLSITDNALTTLSVTKGSGNIIIDNSNTLTTVTNKTLNLTVNGQTGGTLDDADIYTTLNVTATGVNSTLANITTGAATVLNLTGSKNLTLTSTTGLSSLANVNVNGSAGLVANVSGATVTAVSTAATTGSSTLTVDTTKATFTGGAGVDVVTSSGNVSKAVSLGAGNDTFVLGANALATGGSIAGAAGTDTLSISAATAATETGLGAASTFATTVTGFETLLLTAATNQTIDLDLLGKYTNVTTAAGNGLTLQNLPSGGTLTLTGAGTAYTISSGAFSLPGATSDVVNLVLTDGSGAGVSFASTGITAAGVETFNITTVDTQATPTGTFSDSVTLLGNSAKTIVVTGNAGLNLTATDTALTNLDASGISTPATAGLTFTSGALAAAATIKGSLIGDNVITASAATKAVTYTGGAGADSVTINNGQANVITLGNGINSATLGGGNNTVTGGTGADTVTAGAGNNIVTLGNGANAFTATSGNNTYTGGTGVDTVSVGGGTNTITTGTGADSVSFTAVTANVNTFSSITDAHSTLNIGVIDRGTEVFNATKVVLASTAVFQDFANAVIQQGGNASVNGKIGYFNFASTTNGVTTTDTYIVESLHDGSGTNASFINGTDLIIRLAGVVDLSTATLSGNILTLA